MTRDGTVGRFRRNRAKPGVSSGHRSRLNDEDSVRGPHQGQQSTRTAPTGRTHDCKRPLRCTPNDLLPGRGHPHMKRRNFIALLGGAAVVLNWIWSYITYRASTRLITGKPHKPVTAIKRCHGGWLGHDLSINRELRDDRRHAYRGAGRDRRLNRLALRPAF